MIWKGSWSRSFFWRWSEKDLEQVWNFVNDDLPIPVPRIQSVEVKTRSGPYTKRLESNGYITLQICTPICCQVERLGHNGQSINGFVPGNTVQIRDHLFTCQNLELRNLSAVRLTHWNNDCKDKIRSCKRDQKFQGWYSEYLSLVLDDETDIKCHLPSRIHFEQVDVVNLCQGPWIDIIKSGFTWVINWINFVK